MKVSQQTIQQWVQEDVPYFDLTTHLLGIGEKRATIEVYAREEAIVSGSEEARIICNQAGLDVTLFTPSGSAIAAYQPFFAMKGDFATLNQVGKVIQNIFEYASGIATRTQRLNRLAKSVNPEVSILTTRKVFPGTKELAIKSVLAGGAYPHRLGLSETILLFKQHIDFIGGFGQLAAKINEIKQKDCDKKILIEVDKPEEAKQIYHLPIDGIQYDKLPTDELKQVVTSIRKENPHLIHLAAGGVNDKNIADYAATGVDGIVTTWIYFGKPIDIGVKYQPVAD